MRLFDPPNSKLLFSTYICSSKWNDIKIKVEPTLIFTGMNKNLRYDECNKVTWVYKFN